MAVLTGTAGADTLTGTAEDDVLTGGGGADVLDGRGGQDTASYESSGSGLNIFMVPSNDASGDAWGDVFISIENVRGSNFGDFIHGDGGSNRLYGLGGRDTLYGAGGADQLYGGADTDNLVGGAGTDFMDGGEGIDTLSYQLADGGVTVSLADPGLNTGWAAGDRYVSVEDLTGTLYDDVIYGDAQAVNNLWGLAGNDRIYGGAGYDVLIGDAGADYLDGGEGTDLADYETAKSAVVASLADPSRNTGDAAGDVYVSIEDLAGSAYDDVLYGDAQGNGINAWPGNDTVYGGDGNDGLDGAEGDDLLYGEGGWDLLVGGAGRDMAGYTGGIAGYRVYLSDGSQFPDTAGAYMVSAGEGFEGTDTLRQMEGLRFADMTVNLTIQDTAAGISATQLKLLQELYVAFFNRVPDADGLEFWITRLQAGESINSISESFYAAGVAAGAVTGYSDAMSSADFVNLVYRNVLGRSEGADAEGLQYWSGALDDGRESRGSLVKAILDSAHTFKGNATWGWVADLLDNKAAVAELFAVTMGLGYLTPEDSISKGMEIAAAVTAGDISAAVALIGVTPEQINL